MKPDFFVARATSKTFKIIWLIHNHLSPEGHLTFMDNPIIRIAAKFPNKNSHYYGLLLLWTLSHGLEVVRIERVTGLLPYKDLEAERPQLMWSLSSAPTWETGAKSSSVERYYYYYYNYIFNVPSGRAGKSFIEELTFWIKQFNSDSDLNSVALKAFMVLPTLILQKSSATSKSKEHSEAKSVD